MTQNMSLFNEDLLTTASFNPISFEYPDAWCGHLPFAAWVIATLKPQVFVELGTHTGNSYFAFCQSVLEKNLSAKCYAVDTWEGDEHAGRYGDEVFNKVSEHNQLHYAAFSRLLKMKFDDALMYFSDASIDLLHIDGLHTYEAVKHDFETWLPKLAPGAVVLFHDTNVRERQFGVWKYWEELEKNYPSHFEFFHSHGLGVLQLDGASDEKELSFFGFDPKKKQCFKDYFASLGIWQLDKYKINELKKEATGIQSQLCEQGNLIANLQSSIKKQQDEIADKDEQISKLKNDRFKREARIESVELTVSQQGSQIANLRKMLDEREQVITSINQSNFYKIYIRLSWIKRLFIRCRLATKAFFLAIGHEGGLWRLVSKTLQVIKKEGVNGIRFRIRFLLTREANTHSVISDVLSFDPNVLSRQRSLVLVKNHEPVDIIVCVHNALADVKVCLESVLMNTLCPYQLILVDDGSEQTTKKYLEDFVSKHSATLVRNEVAKGYTKAANQGMLAAKNQYVILLNSDTIPPPNWVDRLVECAASDQEIGMVGPLSNTASWQSVPKITNENGDWAENPLPNGWSVNQFADEVIKVSPRIYPRVGFLNGFCLLIKRSLLDDIGYFDEDTFAKGYGEENDYCLRATNSGWQLAVADDCYVYHAQSKSYSHERRAELCRLADEALGAKHGRIRIESNLAITQSHPALQYMRKSCENIEAFFSVREQAKHQFNGKKLLFLLPSATVGGGGNIVLLEAYYMQSFGVEVTIANLECNRSVFENHHPNLTVPVIYLNHPDDLIKIANQFDAIIATLYATVYWLKPLLNQIDSPILGYYVQDFEPYFFSEGTLGYEQALASYTEIPSIKLFTKTNWNYQIIENKLGVSPVIVGSSVDVGTFYPSSFSSPSRNRKLRIAAMVRPSSPRRGPVMTMRVLQRLYEQFHDRLEIMIFGVHVEDPEYLSYPRNFSHRCLGELSNIHVASLLSQTDIFIDCSTFQAMGLTAMEAMASGAAVIGPVNGGLSEIIVNDYSGLLVDTQNEDSIVKAACRLIENNDKLNSIRNNAFNVLDRSPLYSSFNILKCLFSPNVEADEDLMSANAEVY